MKDVEILGVGLRILGIYFLMQIIPMIGTGFISIQNFSPEFMNTNDKWSLYLSMWLPIILIFFTSVFFLVFPVIIAKKLIPRTVLELDKAHFDENIIVICATRIFGIYLVAFGLSDVAFNSLMVFQQVNLNMGVTLINDENFIYLISTFFEISIGIYLLLGAKGILKVIKKFRG